MPESSVDAVILIAISWQALERAKDDDVITLYPNCIVSLVFAAFFIEANLNHIIESMNKTKDMKDELKNNDPGLKTKLAWFYNSYDAQPNVTMKYGEDRKKVYKELPGRFPGFDEICDFRDNTSHGKINPSIASYEKIEELRNQAKFIVDNLFYIANKAGHVIPRTITYKDAINYYQEIYRKLMV